MDPAPATASGSPTAKFDERIGLIWSDRVNLSFWVERQHIVAIAYLMCGFSELHRLKCDHVVYSCLARKVFGHRLCLKVDGEPIGEQSTMCFGNMQSDEGDMLLDIELAEKITNQDL
jgi:hypothetical protein